MQVNLIGFQNCDYIWTFFCNNCYYALGYILQHPAKNKQQTKLQVQEVHLHYVGSDNGEIQLRKKWNITLPHSKGLLGH